MYTQPQVHYPLNKYPTNHLRPTSNNNDRPLTIAELAEFSSLMVYLMWHARRPSVMALHDLSKIISNQQTSDCRLEHSKETAAIANRTSAAFKKFCKQVLTATQVSESVILLGLKYIAMLLQSNPSIQGATGSEYRLFTVALMLGNKFLDDNTFTNKSWSKVTGMKVKDLNMMELEFLNVLGFQLFVQKEEFERYKSALLLLRHQLLNANGHLLEEVFENTTNNQQKQTPYRMMSTSKAQLPQFSTQPFDRPSSQIPLHLSQSNMITAPTYHYTSITFNNNYYYYNNIYSQNYYYKRAAVQKDLK